jgi:hypothetical protein
VAAEAGTTPRYFEEEDDAADMTYTFDEQDLATEATGYGAAEYTTDDDLLDELDELPDFGPPPPVMDPALAPARQDGRTAAADTTPVADDAAATATAAVEASNRATRIITGLRGMHGGGAPTTQQRTAYRNIVVAELGEPKVKSLVAGVWRTTPEKLGPEQLDALISWGKRETFAEDVDMVLVGLRAEREKTRQTANGGATVVPPAPAPAPAPAAETKSTKSTAAPRRGSRTTPPGDA